MAQKASGLADLMAELGDVDEFCGNLADRFRTAFTSLKTEAATTEGIIANVEEGAAKLQAVNRKFSNGGPTVKASAGSSEPSPTPNADADPAALRPAKRIDL